MPVHEKAFSLEIVTPARVVFQGEVTSFSAPGTLGGFQVLYNHAPLLSSLEVGVLKVRDLEGHDTLYATGGGFVEVKDNRAVVLAESAEIPGEIDVARAKAAMERAKKRLETPGPDTDVDRARVALARALNRLHLAKKS
jgi:F-type H+-transporting ATPase subunit epsilon